PLPLSPAARANAAHGRATFETLRFERGHDLRVLTLPVIRDGALVEVVQVGMSLAQRERTLRRYFQSLLVLVPLAVALAATGGALMARAALRPVDQMSAAARRITAEALALDLLDVGARLSAGTGVAVRLKEATPAAVRGDADALRRAALNLVENAVKYTPPGGTVATSVTRDGEAALFVVEDTGPGVP